MTQKPTLTQTDDMKVIATRESDNSVIAAEHEPVKVGAPLMRPKHVQLFSKYLSNGTSYLEWGIGGSTKFALDFKNLKNMTSVDTNKDWIAAASRDVNLSKAILEGRLQTKFVDVGETNMIGYPLNENGDVASDVPSAIGRSVSDVPSAGAYYDVVLVDGRYRLACALKCIRDIQSPFVLLMHDYQREEYHKVERFADRLELANDTNPPYEPISLMVALAPRSRNRYNLTELEDMIEWAERSPS